MMGMIPTPVDASQVQIAMPMPIHVPPLSPPPPPPSSKSSIIEILKLVIGVLIVLSLGAILIVLIIVPRINNTDDARESNENIAKLQRDSNEEIARLQREQQNALENERQKNQQISIEKQFRREIERIERQENLTERYRLEDRIIEEHHRQEDFNRAMDQFRLQLEIEQRRYELLLEERKLAEQHRQEDRSRENTDLVFKFLEDSIYTSQPLDRIKMEARIQSLLRRLDPTHKSLLIDSLYKAKLLTTDDPNNPPLNLHGANLGGLNFSGIDAETGEIVDSQNYNELALPSTSLVNASFDKLMLNAADFSRSNLMRVSFVSAIINNGNFTHSLVSLTDFRYAELVNSSFPSARIHRASFEGAQMFQARMNNTNIELTDFRSIKAIEMNFSRSEILNSTFQNADISYAQMNYATIRSSNFYAVNAIQTDFTRTYMPDCHFQWANLHEASFRYAALLGSSFQNANVQDVDFTRAILIGVRITSAQLDTVLSITNATLPEGGIGKNKNLLKNAHAQCVGPNEIITDWIISGDVFTHGSQMSNDCVFQARTPNTTLQQTIDINRYNRLIENGEGQVYIEMQVQMIDPINPLVYMILRFFNANNAQIETDASTINMFSSTPSPKFTTRIPCPLNTVKVQVNVVLREINATVDNIYVTIE